MSALVVYKYEFDQASEKVLALKCHWEDPIVLFGRQSSGVIAFWIAHDLNPYRKIQSRVFEIIPTGIPANGKHHASFIDGAFVWHLIETS